MNPPLPNFLKINNSFSENRRIVHSERYSNLLNFSLGDAFLAILEDLTSKIFFYIGPDHGGSPMSLNLILSPSGFNFVAPSLAWPLILFLQLRF